MLQRLAAAATVVLLALVATDARATGIGAFFEYGNVFDGEIDTSFGDLGYDEDHFAGGLTIDTNVAYDSLFNYRLDVGYEHVEGDYGGFDDDGDGLMIDNSFGFGVVRNERLRLWVGPAVRLSFDDFESGTFDFGVGVGPAIGLYLHTGEALSVGLTTGYQLLYVVSDPDRASSEDGYEQIVFLRLSVLFRTASDRFDGI